VIDQQQFHFEPSFNRAVKVQSRDQRLSSDAGAVLLREADHRLGLVESLAAGLRDPRNPEKIRYTQAELLRERIYALALGYGAEDDLDLLAHDPVLKVAVWDRPGDHVVEERLASQPTTSRLLSVLAWKDNLETLRGSLPDWIHRHLRATGDNKRVLHGTLDIDAFPVQIHGSQPGGAYNGYYQETVYCPLVASFCPEGDYDSKRLGQGYVHAILRAGDAAPAENGLRFILNAVKKCSGFARVVDVRMDAAFTIGKIMDTLKARGIRFVGRLRSNPVLERLAAPHITRPAGRPPAEGYEYTVELGWYQAEDWKYPQRVVLVVVDKPDPKTGQLEIFPRSFFLVTTWTKEEKDGEALLAHYRRRGTFEDRFSEFNEAIGAHLSSPRFQENEASLLLYLQAMNLVSMLRAEMEAATDNGWDLARLQRSVLRAGAQVIKTGHRLVIFLATAVLPLWELLTARIARWSLPPIWRAPRGAQKRPWVPPPSHAFRSPVLRH
jgi:hypothetical protein